MHGPHDMFINWNELQYNYSLRNQRGVQLPLETVARVTSQAKNVRDVRAKKKRRRRKKASKSSGVGASPLTATSSAPASASSPISEQGLESEHVLINEHSCSDLSGGGTEDAQLLVASGVDEQSAPELDLAACKEAMFEEKESTPGVNYLTTSGEAGWTPVRHRRHQRRSKSDSSDEEDAEHKLQASIKSARGVVFQTREGIPG